MCSKSSKQVASPPPSKSVMNTLPCDVVIGYSFWSLVQELGPMIWFYPLNELDITGYEAFVLVVFSPLMYLLSNTSRRFFQSSLVHHALLLIMIGGCAAIHAQTTLSRLVVLSIGVGTAFLVQCNMWWMENEQKRKSAFWGFTLGYIALLSSKIWYVSITPMWNDETTNKALIAILVVAVGTRIMLEQISAKATTASTGNQQEENETKTRKSSCAPASIGYGAACYILHSIFGEVSLVSRFSVKGFPDPGPMPNPWGGLILVMMTTGLFVSFHTDLAESKIWSLFGVLSSIGLMFLPGWAAFASGAFLALYIMSVWPCISEKMVLCENPGKSLLIANTVYLIGVFGMVWCTAYNFVPFGGELARERTYVIIASMMFMVAWATTRKTYETGKLTISLQLPEKKFYVKSQEQRGSNSKDAVFGKTLKKYLFLFAMAGLLGFEYRKHLMPKYNILVNQEDKSLEARNHFSALIWTFHFGYDNQGRPSLERAAELLNNTGADVITLLESDASKPYLGNKDIAMWLGEKLGMYVDFGPSTRDHTWGNLLLSKYPIIKSKHHLLPSPEGELAPAISASVNISGNLVDFVVTHMGNDGDDLDRRLQAEALSNLCDKAENPVVFLGYVTSSPGSRDYKQLLTKGRMQDIDATDRDRWCEYILYRGLTKLAYARISHGGLSDTELQMAKWKFTPKSTGSLSTPESYKFAGSKDSIPPEYRFNTLFGNHYAGHWHGKGHHYHMSTPKYFVLN